MSHSILLVRLLLALGVALSPALAQGGRSGIRSGRAHLAQGARAEGWCRRRRISEAQHAVLLNHRAHRTDLGRAREDAGPRP